MTDVLEKITLWVWDRMLRVFLGPGVYNSDGLVTVHRHAFMEDPPFQRAYARGIQATGKDYDPYQFQWRMHVVLWAAANATLLDGDFVECGVNEGVRGSAIMEQLGWDQLGRTFYLLDTFSGLDPRYITDENRARNEQFLRDGSYVTSVDAVRKNFAEWQNVRIIVGPVPDTLPQVDTGAVAFLHLDMNCVEPEVAALRYFWPKLTPGAFVLLDDYAYKGYEPQRLAMDALAAELGVLVCALPTGQGLIIRPPSP